MWSYDAKAIQGFDKSFDGIHYQPGNIYPNLEDGDQNVATVFFGVPQNKAVDITYAFSVDAVSAVFMHEFTLNEYTTGDIPGAAATEWIITFPTKNFYVDFGTVYPPFTQKYGASDCEVVSLVTFDRDERTFTEERGGILPPVVSPAPPYVCNPEIEFCRDVVFELCNEVNVLRFGERSIFGTPEDIDGDSLLLTVQDEFTNGWGWIDYYFDKDHVDDEGLAGLPVTGFAAYQFENDFVEGDDGSVKAFYGGLFQHKGNVRRVGTN